MSDRTFSNTAARLARASILPDRVVAAMLRGDDGADYMDPALFDRAMSARSELACLLSPFRPGRRRIVGRTATTAKRGSHRRDRARSYGDRDLLLGL